MLHSVLTTTPEKDSPPWVLIIIVGLVVAAVVVLLVSEGRVLAYLRPSARSRRSERDSHDAASDDPPAAGSTSYSPVAQALAAGSDATVNVPPAARTEAAPPAARSGIFISYRRQDEPNFAGRLYDRLAGHFGRDTVFMDVDTIDLGLDFAEVIDQSLAGCRVMIVVIGKRWLTVVDEEGEPRLHNPDDYVRLEVERALQSEIRVIPVLVEGAASPKAAQLPAALGSLARRNAIAMSHESFTSDSGRLIATLHRILEPAATESRSPEDDPVTG